MNKKDLWLRLYRYNFDHIVPPNLQDRIVSAFGGHDPSTHAFASKISRKLGWDVKFAHRALREYKKFLYLGVTATFSVTPPKILDQVWHEHILFTKAYRDFCNEVLGQPFDHNPELMPSSEQTEAYRLQYHATLALYLKEFGYEAPVMYWGTPKFDSETGSAKMVSELPPSRPQIIGYHDYSSDPPLVLWGDSDLDGTFLFVDDDSARTGFWDSFGGDSIASDGGTSDGGSSDGGSSDGGGCSSGCGSCGGGGD